MSNENKKTTKRIYTLAAATGLALGTMGIAAAATSTQAAPAPATQNEAPAVTEVQLTDTVQESEAPTDEAVDGIDYQFEGQEVGDNGDGIPDADDATEVEEAEDANDTDGVEHENEGEEVGNNGDGIADADDANEAAETTNG